MNKILTEENDEIIIGLLDELERINRGNGNGLTSAGTIALSAILFTYNPDKYLMTLHFKHRLALINFFNFGDVSAYQTYGEKIVKTRNDIISSFKESFGIDTTPSKLSFFVYCQLDGKYDWKGASEWTQTSRLLPEI